MLKFKKKKTRAFESLGKGYFLKVRPFWWFGQIPTKSLLEKSSFPTKSLLET